MLLAGRSALARRSLSRPLSCAWSRRQHGGGWRVAPPELAARLAAGVGQSVAVRSELAASLSSSWRAEPVGEPAALQGGAGAGKAFAFALRSGEAEVGMLRAALWQADRAGDVSTAMLFAPQCHPALPLSTAALPLIDCARATLHQHGAERVAAVAALPGLCAWVVETRGREPMWKTESSGSSGWEALPGSSQMAPRRRLLSAASGCPESAHRPVGPGIRGDEALISETGGRARG